MGGRRGARPNAVLSGTVPTRRQMCTDDWVKKLGKSNIYDFGSMEGAVRSSGGASGAVSAREGRGGWLGQAGGTGSIGYVLSRSCVR
jgi:hypothetical protein